MREADEERLLRALQPSRRVLVRMNDGRWGVLASHDRRRRPVVVAADDLVAALAEAGRLTVASADSYVLSDGESTPVSREPAPRWVFVAETARRPGRRDPGVGFAGMATQARHGRGLISLRHAQAGLRLITDAERASADTRMTMDWDAGPSTRQRRSGSAGGPRGDALAAARVLMRVRTKIGEPAWRLAWSLCVDGDSLNAIRKRFAVSQARLKPLLVDALEKLAAAYEA